MKIDIEILDSLNTETSNILLGLLEKKISLKSFHNRKYQAKQKNDVQKLIDLATAFEVWKYLKGEGLTESQSGVLVPLLAKLLVAEEQKLPYPATTEEELQISLERYTNDIKSGLYSHLLTVEKLNELTK